MTTLESHCCFCSMQCGIKLVPQQSTAVTYKIKPSDDFPVATGRLCQKGFHVMEHTKHPSRVLHPLKRVTSNEWQKSNWNEALDSISLQINEIQKAYGKDAVAVYGGGSLTNEMCYLLGKFTRVALQSKHIDYNGRFCMSSAAAAANQAFGIDRGLTMPLSDIPKAKFIILAGTNIAECQPTMVSYIMEAKKNNAVVVTIDPRNTMTSKLGDIHVRLLPGLDSVFVNGLLHIIIHEQLYDADFVHDRTHGIAELIKAVEDYSPQKVEEITGVSVEVQQSIARGFAQAHSSIVLTARGIEQQINGVENTLNYINLCLVTGKIGKPGSGYGSITGQANGQGGREHGQKADQLPGYRHIEDEQARQHVAKVWGIQPNELPGKGVSAYEMIEKIDREEIKAMIVLGSNPIVSAPDTSFVKRSLKKLKLLVVIDMFQTETSQYADWILPGSSFLEAEGTITNLEGRVFHRPQVCQTPQESTLDYQIICKLADKLGRGRYFQYESIEDVFDELALASAGGRADYSGMNYDRLKTEKGIFWPCTSIHHPGTPQMFKDGFGHLDGKAKLVGIVPKLPSEPTDSNYPYVLTTGKIGIHYLSGAQTRRTDDLNEKALVPIAEIHPWLAKQIGIGVNSRIRLTSRRDSIILDVKISEKIHQKTIFVPFHWGGKQSVNRLINHVLDPTSGIPEFKNCAVKAECINE